jgi:hypothetical protein
MCRTATGWLGTLAARGLRGQGDDRPLPPTRPATDHSLEGVCHIRSVGTTPITVAVSIFSNNATVLPRNATDLR